MNAERGTRNAETLQRPARVLICFALKEETVAFREFATDRADIQVLITGIGRKNAMSKVGTFLKSCRPQSVLTCGFAGGLNPALAIGDVVFAADDDSLRERLILAGARPATFVCSSRVVITNSEKSELRRTTMADAVEMESEAIHEVCREQGIPCATVRVISDSANENLPLDFNQLSKTDSSLHFGKLAVAIAKSPGKISALLRLQKNCRFAAGRLAGVLEKVFRPC